MTLNSFSQTIDYCLDLDVYSVELYVTILITNKNNNLPFLMILLIVVRYFHA